MALAELPVAKLFVDPRYQRASKSRTSQELIARIARDFKWAKFGAAAVMPWAARDGWAILDGQHRTEAARACGIDTVPCLVHPEMSPADAARVFVGINTDRVAMHPMALHHARVAAGDPVAMRIGQICAEAGIVVARYPVHLNKMTPGMTFAAATIYKAFRLHGEAALVAALGLCARAFSGQSGRLRAPVIHGVAAACALLPAGNRAALGATLRDTPKADFAELVAAHVEDGKGEWFAVRGLAMSRLREPHPLADKAGGIAARTEEPAEPERLSRAGEDSKPASDLHVAKTRKCLGCGEFFKSEWAGNRLCRTCGVNAARKRGGIDG